MEGEDKRFRIPVGGPEAERAKAKAMMMTSVIQFSKDKTFAMTMGAPMKGTWKATGHNIALTITDLMGRKMSEIVDMARSTYRNDPSPQHKAVLDELSKPLMAVLSSNGKTLTLKPAPGKAGAVFMKA